MTRSIRTWPLITKTLSTAIILAGLVFPGLAYSDWEYFPVLRLGVDLDDNATLTTRTDEVQDLSGLIAEARLGIVSHSATGLFSIEPILRSRRYDDDDFFDSNDQFLNFRMRRDGANNTFSLRGIYGRESVRTAELADVDLESDIDPDEFEDDDTGQVELRQRREKLRIVPRWVYRFSDVSRINTDLNLVTVNFEDDEQQVLRLTDYTDARARIAYERTLSQRNTGVILATARRYETSFLDGDFSGYGFSVGLDRELTQTSTFRALVGLEKAEQLGDSNDEPHVVADISVVRRQETTRLLAQYRRRIAASGRGALSARDEFNLRFTRDLTDKFSAGIGARAYESTRLGLVGNESKFVQLNAQVLWRLSSAFAVQANYRYTVLDRSTIGESANSNRFTVWFSYQPNSQSGISFYR